LVSGFTDCNINPILGPQQLNSSKRGVDPYRWSDRLGHQDKKIATRTQRIAKLNGNEYLVSPMRSLVTGLLTLGILTSVQVSSAEDPVVVVYDDPSLTRLEKQIGVTPAQKDRFDDIVVKYRDPQAGNDSGARTGTDADSGSGPQSGGRGGGGRGHGGGGGGGRGGSAFTGAKGDNLRQELDDLATVLTPAQLQKFKDLSKHKKKPEHPSSQ
jgi:hypothetical protein